MAGRRRAIQFHERRNVRSPFSFVHILPQLATLERQTWSARLIAHDDDSRVSFNERQNAFNSVRRAKDYA